MEGHLMMSKKERERLKILARVKGKELKMKDAAELSEALVTGSVGGSTNGGVIQGMAAWGIGVIETIQLRIPLDV